LTRASIYLRKNFFEEMDCRVKPGNDAENADRFGKPALFR
jgi:hypothetical protein